MATHLKHDDIVCNAPQDGVARCICPMDCGTQEARTPDGGIEATLDTPPMLPLLSVDPVRLFRTYIAAVVALAACVAVSFSVLWSQSNDFTADNNTINISGRQGMLSQLILSLAERAHQTHTLHPADRVRLEGAVDLFLATHLRLTQAPDLEPHISALYFGGTPGDTLDDRILQFGQAARTLINAPGANAPLANLQIIDSKGLLADLNSVVDAYEAASDQRIRSRRAIGQLALLSVVAMVVAQLVFAYLPGHRAIKSNIAALRTRNMQLSETRAKLHNANADLGRQNQSLTATQSQLAEAHARSEALNKQQAEFTYALLHDLKSPANSMRFILDELQDEHAERLDADGKALLASAMGTLQRMVSLIGDVLEYSVTSDTDAGLPAETVDMGQVLSDVLDDLAASIQSAKARVICGPVMVVQGRHNQLRILAQNLIANAIKFCAPGSVPEVRVACRPLNEPDAWQLIVQDNGIGIPAEQKARIFGLFQRLHVHSAYPGTGLGLATCQRVAAMHRGSIEVVSAPGAGSTFCVTLRPPVVAGDAGTDVAVAAA